jgi:tRNA(Ile)-lysidine synthase
VSLLLRQVEDFIATHRLLRRNQGVLVAVSGGLDSMVLLELLRGLQSQHGWRLAVAHYNHRLRGSASEADEALVKDTADRLGLRCVVGRGDVAACAKTERLSLEMAARKLRHAFLARTARELGLRTVALAHHADDQVELCFLRLLRGTGGSALAGMRASSPSPTDPRVKLVRPLLCVTRGQLAVWARGRQVVFREDASNTKATFLRNRIRRRLLPLLEREFQPAIRRTTLRAMEITAAESEFVREAAEQWLATSRRASFRRLHVSVQRQALRLQLLRLGVAPEFDLIEQLRRCPDRAVCLAPGRAVVCGGSGRVRTVRLGSPSFDPAELTVGLGEGRGRIAFGAVTVRWRIEDNTQSSGWPRFRPGCEFFDADRVGSAVVLRRWRAGDRFRPIGMALAVKLQDLFVNARVPRAERHYRVVAATAGGEILWVEGLRIGDGFKLDKGTTRRLKWQWRRGDPRVAPMAGA